MQAEVAAVVEMAAEVAVEVTLESLNVLVGSVMVGQEIAVEMVEMEVMVEEVDKVDGVEDMPGMDQHGLIPQYGKADKEARVAVEVTPDQEATVAAVEAAAVEVDGDRVAMAVAEAVVVTMEAVMSTVADIMETAEVEEEMVAEAVEITATSGLHPTMDIDIPNVSY